MDHLYANFTPFSSKDFTTINRNWSHYPGLQFTFQFEEYLLDNLQEIRAYVKRHPLMPLSLSLVYCLSIVRVKAYMQYQPPFVLRAPLICWNAALALFSIFGSIRVLPELFWMISNKGLFASTCDDRFIDVSIHVFTVFNDLTLAHRIAVSFCGSSSLSSLKYGSLVTLCLFYCVSRN